MRIGIAPNFDRAAGGTYQYAMTMVRALAELAGDHHEFVLFLYAGETVPGDLADLGLTAVELRTVAGPARAVWGPLARLLSPRVRGWLRRLASGAGGSGEAPAPGSEGAKSPFGGRGRLIDPLWKRWFEARGVDLLVFTNENDLAFRTGVPYIVAIHDLQHRLHPEFEEVSGDGEAERREYRVGNCVRDATLVLVDSEVGKEDMLTFYGPEGVEEDGVFVLPFLPADYLGAIVSAQECALVRETYDLPARYLFYPAQFAPSKNHVRIVEAIGMLNAEGLPVHVVLAGTHSGALRERTHAEALATAERLGIRGLIHDVGYVPDEAMPALYAEADALIMPTFFGPTNIPVLEAWSHDCPVITSDVRGIREQAGDAAILVDPGSVASIAGGIRRLVGDPALRDEVARRGRDRLSLYTRDEYLRRLSAAILRATSRTRASGGSAHGAPGDREEAK
jgi:glycosyltransferase involved in cell wall biosynthesis